MKKFLLLAVAILAVMACNPQPEGGYIIKGTVAGDAPAVKSGKVILKSMSRDQQFSDTVALKNGKFTFTGKVATPDRYVVTIEGVKGYLPIFLENTAYTVTGKVDAWAAAQIEGSLNQKLFDLAKQNIEKLNKRYNTEALIQEYRAEKTTSERKEEIVALFDQLNDKLSAFEDSLVEANRMSYYALEKFISRLDEMPFDQMEKRLNEFLAVEEFKANAMVQEAKSTLEVLRKIQPGQTAPDLKMKTPDGKEIALSEVYKKNKVTMIDFWAGWCPPCRAFNPELVKIYKDYHKKGFEVYAISLDREKANWEKAIKDDGLPWIHVSDVSYWDCEATRLYHIRSIPSNVFVDQNGVILARKCPKDEIVALLQEHLK